MKYFVFDLGGVLSVPMMTKNYMMKLSGIFHLKNFKKYLTKVKNL